MSPKWWCVGFGTVCTFLSQQAFDVVYGFGVVSVAMALIVGVMAMFGLAAYLSLRER